MALKRELGLADAVLLVVGNVVGAGIFTTSGFLAGEVPQPLWFVGIWVFGGLLTLCGALTYAELAGMFPRTGGDARHRRPGWAGLPAARVTVGVRGELLIRLRIVDCRLRIWDILTKAQSEINNPKSAIDFPSPGSGGNFGGIHAGRACSPVVGARPLWDIRPPTFLRHSLWGVTILL